MNGNVKQLLHDHDRMLAKAKNMGWRGFLRTLEANARRMEREAHREQRRLEKQHQEWQRMAEFERAAYEVAVYENRVELLTSVHRECGEVWDWQGIASKPAPAVPVRGRRREQRARQLLTDYQPSFWDRLFEREESKEETLKEAVSAARQKDEDIYKEVVAAYEQEWADWDESRRFAARILAGELAAYKEAIGETHAFDDINAMRSVITFKFPDPRAVEVKIEINGKSAIPTEIKTQLRSGSLSVKPLPVSRQHEIHQAYVCGCALRVARELFALLPIQIVIATACEEVLNTQTGHLETQPLVSVAVPRQTVTRLRWDTVDPSDAMANFLHRMCFKKTKGLVPIDNSIKLSDLQLP